MAISRELEMEQSSRITVGDLRRKLSEFPADTEITFGNTIEAVPLVFERVKSRGDRLVQIELNEMLPEIINGDGVIELEQVGSDEWRRTSA